jgi:hypothetical protein
MIKKVVFALIICSGIRLIIGAGAVLYAQHIDCSEFATIRLNIGELLDVYQKIYGDVFLIT